MYDINSIHTYILLHTYIHTYGSRQWLAGRRTSPSALHSSSCLLTANATCTGSRSYSAGGSDGSEWARGGLRSSIGSQRKPLESE